MQERHPGGLRRNFLQAPDDREQGSPGGVCLS